MARLSGGYVVGMDEAGRGALAGPVFVAAVALPLKERAFFSKLCRGWDSKKMGIRERERIYAEMLSARGKGDLVLAVSFSGVSVIGKKNITRAANASALRAYQRLSVRFRSKPRRVLLDGGLFLQSRAYQEEMAQAHGIPISTIVRADERFVEASLASVAAKCSRDAYMRRLHVRYPCYGLREHKGYGTERHLAAIKVYGTSNIHRLTFLRKYSRILSLVRFNNTK